MPQARRMLEQMPPRRVTFAAVALVIAATTTPGALASPSVRLRADGIGAVHFGLAEARAVGELRALFGAPSARGFNTGCGPRYTEVVWGELAAEFRSGRFSGYRYSSGGYPLTTPGSPQPRPTGRPGKPMLVTPTGVSLGSTLRQLRAAYRLRLVGASRRQAPNGLVFVDDAKRDPEPPASRIIEIKIGTCGDF